MLNKYITKKYASDSGFTLLELLIVISIIVLLTSISLFALQGARGQGRDGKRKTDLETIRAGLELYKADCNQYPASLPNPGSSLTGDCTGVINTYIQSIPGDPSSLARYSYTRVTSSTYNLCSYLENPPRSSKRVRVTGCGTCDPSPCRYKITNP